MIDQIRTISAGGLDLAVAEAGAGGRPLMLVHGFTGAKEDMADWLEPLASRGWHAVAPDLRGHGASAKPVGAEHYGLARLAEEILALADALGWARFAVLGHSMGGMAAQMAALSAPERVEALVLMGTGHGAVEGISKSLAEMAVELVAEGGMDLLADVMAVLESPLTTEAHRQLVESRPETATVRDRNLRATAPDLYRVLALELLEHEDRLDQLASLSMPVLVLVGEQDEVFLEASRRLAAAIPDASLAVVPAAGHCPQLENPEGFWTALAAFLDRVAAGGRS